MQEALTAKLQHFAQSEAVRSLQAVVDGLQTATWTLPQVPQETLRNLNEAVETARRTLRQTFEAVAPLAEAAGAVIKSLQDARDNLLGALRPLWDYFALVKRHLAQGAFFRGRVAKRGRVRLRFRRLAHERVLKLFFVYLLRLRRGRSLSEALKMALKALTALLALALDLIRLTHEPQKTLPESLKERPPPKDPTQNLTKSLVIAPVAPPLAA
ncbi:hypothetical protein SAMN04488243_11713 [Thermus arciformis]|uniref:Uncharacterized protein n=1 Tax=Thermus arciformis TaxID=482827 RepID=A0A1G7H210_9DEIN|nr:hypothetical protein [Thermus arciformis]SDE94385.1 hypothetical protein SAMN04488243_11713 [Thermus arciformis]